MKYSPISKTFAAVALGGIMLASIGASADAGYGQMDEWTTKANRAVDGVMAYPVARIRGSGNGVANFQVTVDRDGNVIDREQTRRPPSLVLNMAAKKVLRKADFPALPASYERETLTFMVQLNYGAGGPGLRETDLLRPGRVTSRQLARGNSPAFASLQIISAEEE